MLFRSVQRNPIMQGSDAIEHIDLIIIKKGEKVEVDVAVHVDGESAPGTITNLELNSILIEVDALKIPESVVVSIEGLEEGAQVLAGDVPLPEGATLISEPDHQVLGIIVPQLEAETAETEDVDEPVAASKPAEEDN